MDLLLLFSLGCFGVLFAALLVAGWSGPRPLEPLRGLIPSVGGLVAYGSRYIHRHRVQSAAIVVRPWPMGLGETVSIAFSSKLDVRAVKAKLVCLEETKLSSGKYQEVKTAPRLEVDIDTSRDIWAFDIPVYGIPSLAVKSNRVQWLLRLVMSTSNGDLPVEFELLVVPEEHA